MDTSEFERIAFLAATTSLLPQDYDRSLLMFKASLSENQISKTGSTPSEHKFRKKK
jgi:hypothetical protein